MRCVGIRMGPHVLPDVVADSRPIHFECCRCLSWEKTSQLFAQVWLCLQMCSLGGMFECEQEPPSLSSESERHLPEVGSLFFGE